MYVRIARFEGGERNWDEFAASVGETIRSGGQGMPFEKVADVTKRVMLFVDRETNRGANLVLCETEDRRRPRRDNPRGRARRSDLSGDVRGTAR
jgi:hypothetical protein